MAFTRWNVTHVAGLTTRFTSREFDRVYDEVLDEGHRWTVRRDSSKLMEEENKRLVKAAFRSITAWALDV